MSKLRGVQGKGGGGGGGGGWDFTTIGAGKADPPSLLAGVVVWLTRDSLAHHLVHLATG